LRWDPLEPDTLPSGVRHLYIRLRPPYLKEKPLASILKFLLTWPLAMWSLAKLAKEYNIRVFNVYFPDLSSLNFILLKRLGGFGGQVILSLQGSDVRGGCQQQGLSRWLWRLLYRKADVVVACSKGLEEEALMVEERSKTRVFYNAIDVDRFARQADPDFRLP